MPGWSTAKAYPHCLPTASVYFSVVVSPLVSCHVSVTIKIFWICCVESDSVGLEMPLGNVLIEGVLRTAYGGEEFNIRLLYSVPMMQEFVHAYCISGALGGDGAVPPPRGCRVTSEE